MNVSPAPAAVEGVRARAETEIRLAAPVFQIVARPETGQRPIGNFVVIVTGRREPVAGQFVEVGHGIVVGDGSGAVARPAGRTSLPRRLPSSISSR